MNEFAFFLVLLFAGISTIHCGYMLNISRQLYYSKQKCRKTKSAQLWLDLYAFQEKARRRGLISSIGFWSFILLMLISGAFV